MTSANDLLQNAIVTVQSEWNGWRTAMAPAAHLEDVHWAQPRGALRPLLHAVVACDRLQSGHIAHQCELTPRPHRLLVCVLKSHTPAAVFDALSKRASPHFQGSTEICRFATPSPPSPRVHST